MSQVLVGYDGSQSGERALHWAVSECRLRKVDLTICHAWHWPYAFDPVHEWSIDVARRMAGHVLDQGVLAAENLGPQVKIRKVLSSGAGATVLLQEASGSDLIVVGSHGQRGSEGLPAGSTALEIAGRAPCPTVIVRGTGQKSGRIVVGVDGSADSDAALALAFEEAVLHRLEVEVVHAAAGEEPADELQRAAGSRLQTQAAPWCAKYSSMNVHTRLSAEPPRQALLGAAHGAALLVVGRRGQGGIPDLRLGSVSQAMVEYAPCPVMVARA
ncbi:MAG: universal stress protein [Streptosporangiaceae bacterium]